MADNAATKQRLNVSLDYRVICMALLAVIVGMLLLWKPWTAASEERTIEVTGETVVRAEPDEFVFYPAYSSKHEDKAAASDAANKRAEEVITKLKELGVADNKIKLSVNSYLSGGFREGETDEYTFTAQLTITVDNREFAQKVQDYLVTTTPENSVTPQGTFSESKRKEVESQARDEATKDARSKAEQSARNLGFKIGKVKSVEDGAGFSGGPIPLAERAMDSSTISPELKLSLQPGENEITYSVTVVYYMR